MQPLAVCVRVCAGTASPRCWLRRVLVLCWQLASWATPATCKPLTHPLPTHACTAFTAWRPQKLSGFDPLGYSKGDFKGLKQKEIKNGRLAMVAFLGALNERHMSDACAPWPLARRASSLRPRRSGSSLTAPWLRPAPTHPSSGAQASWRSTTRSPAARWSSWASTWRTRGPTTSSTSEQNSVGLSRAGQCRAERGGRCLWCNGCWG